MQGLEDHCFRFAGDEFFNGLPAQLVDKWSAWGVKAAFGYNSSSSILKFLQLIVFVYLYYQERKHVFQEDAFCVLCMQNSCLYLNTYSLIKL